jgi:hypothetical protein
MTVAQIVIRPEFRTAGGEVNDLEINGKYAGTLTLTYREKDRLIGSIQLDKTTLSHLEKEEVSQWADDYVHSLADALRVEECEVLVTFAKFDHIITGYDIELDDVLDHDVIDEELDDAIDDPSLEDIIDPNERDEYTMNEKHRKETVPIRLELVIVGESDNRIEYHIYGKRKAWLAEAFFTIEETEVMGEVNWMVKPNDDEIEAAADLIVSDFDEKAIDTFLIEMKYQDVTLESIELTHEDMLDFKDQWEKSGGNKKKKQKNRQFTAVLVRDDADTLTYDIYEQTQGGLPVGRATVDISQRRLTGFIDFREPTRSGDREIVATTLLRELDKEKDYDSLNLTMIHQNKRIEDIYFENDQLH